MEMVTSMTKKTLVPIGFVVGLLTLGASVAAVLISVGYLVNPLAANTQAMEAELKAQLQEVGSPERAQFIAQRRTVKDTHGAMSNEYRTDLSFDQLKQFYDAELSRHGWQFKKETEILWDRQNLGGKHLFYCKGEFTADLEYSGKLETEFGWTYSLSFTFGLQDPCR